MTSFNPLVPTGLIALREDYANVQANFQQLDTTYGSDHVAYSVALNNGYHTDIHLVPQSTPAPTAGIGQFFAQNVNDGFNTDTALLFETGAGLISKLTSNFQPVIGTNGSSYLPGNATNGLVVQWGIISPMTIGSYTAVSFATHNKQFQNNCFGVWTQVITSGTGNVTNTLVVATVSNTGFSYFLALGGTVTGFYWIAVGN